MTKPANRNPASTEQGWGDLIRRRGGVLGLICLAVWLNAADALVTATVMPDVGRDLGGLRYFSLAFSGFMVGSVAASASAGWLAERLGLGRAAAAAGVILALGCGVSAASGGPEAFLAGRFIQGLGAGWAAGLAMVSVALHFPDSQRARVYAAVAAVWGVATLLGPLVGGLFAAGPGGWRGVFWFFCVQAGVFAVAAPRLMGSRPGQAGSNLPWRSLMALCGALCVILSAPSFQGPAAVGALVLGAMGLAATARFDARSATRLTPVVLADLHRPPGNGYLAMLALTAAGMGLAIYAAPVLQSLAGLTALQAGYVVAVQALVWTGCAFAVGGASERAERLLIPLGAVLIAAAAAGLGPALGTGEAWPAAAAAAVMGAGFGISSSLMNRRVLRSLGAGDLATGSSAFIAVRQVGGAFGASAAGVAANTAGFAVGFSPEIAVETALWTAAPCAVFGLLGIYAALRLSRRRA